MREISFLTQLSNGGESDASGVLSSQGASAYRRRERRPLHRTQVCSLTSFQDAEVSFAEVTTLASVLTRRIGTSSDMANQIYPWNRGMLDLTIKAVRIGYVFGSKPDEESSSFWTRRW